MVIEKKTTQGFGKRVKVEEIKFTITGTTDLQIDQTNLEKITSHVKDLFDKHEDTGHRLISISVYGTYCEPSTHVRERLYEDKKKKEFKTIDNSIKDLMKGYQDD